MTVSDWGQAKVLVINILFGMLCVILFDLFSVIGKRFEKHIAIVNILDGLYFAIAFVLVLYASVKYNFGALRYYQVIGLIMGIGIQILVFSHTEKRIFEKLITLFVKIVLFFIKIITTPVIFVLKIVVFPIFFLEKQTVVLFEKIQKKHKKAIVRKEKKKKTVKKRAKMI